MLYECLWISDFSKKKPTGIWMLPNYGIEFLYMIHFSCNLVDSKKNLSPQYIELNACFNTKYSNMSKLNKKLKIIYTCSYIVVWNKDYKMLTGGRECRKKQHGSMGSDWNGARGR